MDTNKPLPLFALEINTDDDTGTQFIALTELPANETMWCFMSKSGKQIKNISFNVDSDKMILTGIVSRPGQKIYRIDSSGEEYFVYQTKETIQSDALKFAKRNAFKNVNLEHEKPVDNVFVYESWITGKQDKIHSILNDDSIEEGSWAISMKVEDESIWKQIKEKKLTGFSLEGMFIHKEVKQSKISKEETLFNQIQKIIQEIK